MPLNLSWTDYPEKYDDDSLLSKLQFKPDFPFTSGDALVNHLLIKGDNYPVLKKMTPHLDIHAHGVYAHGIHAHGILSSYCNPCFASLPWILSLCQLL